MKSGIDPLILNTANIFANGEAYFLQNWLIQGHIKIYPNA